MLALKKHFIINLKLCLLIALFLSVFIAKNISAKEISVAMWGGLNKQEVGVIRDVAVLIQAKKFSEALDRAKDIKSNQNFYQPLVNIILWNKYSGNLDRSVNFSDISRFATDNGYFPNIKELKSNVEKLVVMKQIPASDYENYFLANPPKNKATKLYVIDRKIDFLRNSSESANQKNELKKLRSAIIDIWINQNLTESEESDFLDRFGSQLGEAEHIARVERLMWDGQFSSVNGTIDLLSEDYKKLFNGMIKINENPKYINSIILSIPRKLRLNEHLQYRRAIYYHINDDVKAIVDLLTDDSLNQVEHPIKWWRLRHIYGRELLKTKDYKDAYKIVSNHSLKSGDEDYPEAEWLSGWIALRFLNKPENALNHFKNFYDNVSNPISVSRGAYWLGMCFEAMKKKEGAMKWYKVATTYPTYFYGQIAIHKYRNMDEATLTNFALPKEPKISENDIKLVSYKMSVKVAYLLALMNDKADAIRILQNVISDFNNASKIAVIVKLIEEMGDENLNHRIYRYANRKNVFFINKQYKILNEVRGDPNVALIHALVKQESGFWQGAVSPVGAIGFMQIMPDTAKNTTRQMGIEYSQDRLATDTKYNVKIGSYYIDSLLKKFDNSKIMAIASYNAGPGRTSKWVEEFYDPRDYGSSENYTNEDIDKIVDWVELLTYGETRNYVQRVMENLLVYNYLLTETK